MTDYFYKYIYPNTNRYILIKTLEEFDFKYDYQDEINTYLKKGNIIVPVTNEEDVKALNIYDIRHQSQIPEEDFDRVLTEKRNQK